MITLKTLPQATAQEVFEQAARHMLTQNAVSKNVNGNGCAYRGVDGLRCAAGCFISDDEYKPEMDKIGKTIIGMGWHEMVKEGFAPSKHEKLIHELQAIHDTEDVCFWIQRLEFLAVKFDLEFNLDKLTNKSVI